MVTRGREKERKEEDQERSSQNLTFCDAVCDAVWGWHVSLPSLVNGAHMTITLAARAINTEGGVKIVINLPAWHF